MAKQTGKISDIFGILQRPGGPVLLIDEMNEVIAQGWAACGGLEGVDDPLSRGMTGQQGAGRGEKRGG